MTFNDVKIELKWAAIFHLMGLLWVFSENAMELDHQNIELHMQYTKLFVVPSIIILCFAFMDKRNNYYKGEMGLKQGATFGVTITLFITLVTPFSQLINSLLITPTFFDDAIHHFVTHGEMTLQEAGKQFSLFQYMKQSTRGAFFLCIIMSTLLTIIATFTYQPPKKRD